MIGDIIKTETFYDVPVRIVQHDGRTMIPLNDIADGITHDRSGLRKLFHRNEEILGKWSGLAKLATPQGTQEQICLNHEGVTAILMKVDFARVKEKTRRQRIIDFQEWAATTLSQIMRGEVVPVKREALEDLVRQHLQIADYMTQFAHVDRGIAASVALARVESESGSDLSWCKALIRKDRQQPPGYLTPTQIGYELGGLSARDINRMLQQLGYQYYLGDRWQPTEIGQNFGENLPFTVINRNGGSHSDYQLKWSPLIVQKLRDHLNGTQAVLAQG